MWNKSKRSKALLLTLAITFSLTNCTNSQIPALNGNGNGNARTFTTQSGPSKTRNNGRQRPRDNVWDIGSIPAPTQVMMVTAESTIPALRRTW